MNLTELKQRYDQIKQSGLNQLTIRSKDIVPLIKQLSGSFVIEEVGLSFERRPIHKLCIGNGPTRLFFWSQMHGNEPTATAALFDLFNFIKDESNRAWVASWEDKLSLQFAPMINPDGSEIHNRYNAQTIDINRDALALQSKEGQILNQLADEFSPHYGFNLHDQNRHYTVKGSANPTTISLLAPAFNAEKDINDSRHNAMKLGSLFNQKLQQLIPGCVGRYDDTYSPRSFGDAFAAKGIATLLIESGHAHNDPTRQTARWLNFMMLVSAIDAIAKDQLADVTTESYDAIPMNHANGLVDIMLRDVNVDNQYKADVSINFARFFHRPRIEEVGDLSPQTGIEERDMSAYRLIPIKGYFLEQPLVLDEQTYLGILRDGFSYFIGDQTLVKNNTDWPVEILKREVQLPIPIRQRHAHMIFDQGGVAKLALIQGQWIDLMAGCLVNYSDNFSIN